VTGLTPFLGMACADALPPGFEGLHHSNSGQFGIVIEQQRTQGFNRMRHGRPRKAGTPVWAASSRDATAGYDARFIRALAASVALAAIIRLLYVLTDERGYVGGDGFTYSLEAHRFADGHVYTSGTGDVAAPMAHHPPAVTRIDRIIARAAVQKSGPHLKLRPS
jgi:hypothetical protein